VDKKATFYKYMVVGSGTPKHPLILRQTASPHIGNINGTTEDCNGHKEITILRYEAHICSKL
jgi:hypothetical protein